MANEIGQKDKEWCIKHYTKNKTIEQYEPP